MITAVGSFAYRREDGVYVVPIGCLGDSDTIGAIVGSIAETRFGIPQEMKFKAMNYLPKDMTRIYQQFKANNEIKKIDKKYKK